MNRILFWALAFVFWGTTFTLTKNDPFFGDAISSISRASNNIYFSDFQEINFPENLDPGHPITIPYLHAFMWRLLGRQLWVSHLLNMLFSMGTVLIFLKWSMKLGQEKYGYLGALLLLATPLFLSQTVNPNLHMALTFCTLGLAYSLRYNKILLQVLFSGGMVITHLQGLYFLAPMWAWWFFGLSKAPPFQRIALITTRLAIPLALFVLWLYYHYNLTGWAISSPDYAGHRGFPGFKRFVINLILADWRIIDYGQLGLFIIPILVAFKERPKILGRSPIFIFLMLYIFNGLALAITTKTGPMHRYFLPCLPFLVLANIEHMHKVKLKTLIVSVVILLSGHLWFYPGKIIGDATLAYRNIFPLMEQAKNDFKNQTLYTYAPLGNPSFDTHLTMDTTDVQHLYDTKITHVPLVCFSNINGDFTTTEKNILQTWPSKTYQKGNIFLEVYSNPAIIKTPLATGPRRQPSWLELQLIKLKDKIKGKDAV